MKTVQFMDDIINLPSGLVNHPQMPLQEDRQRNLFFAALTCDMMLR